MNVGDAVWFRVGANVRTGTINQVLEDASRVWGYRVMPDVPCRGDGESGHVQGAHALFAKPADRERLIRALVDDMDALSDWVGKLSEEALPEMTAARELLG
jgi:hypothetical protein